MSIAPLMFAFFSYVLLIMSGCGVVSKSNAQHVQENWDFPITYAGHQNSNISVSFNISRATSNLSYYGSSWDVWPNGSFSDGGYDVGLVLRENEGAGYRIQVSNVYGDIALVKYPSGGYLRSVPIDISLNRTHRLEASANGNRIQAIFDGKPVIDYIDNVNPIVESGIFAVGASHGASVELIESNLTDLPSENVTFSLPNHVPEFKVRNWIGQRQWVFDGEEPILMLPTPTLPLFNSVKLAPGNRPFLMWHSNWSTYTSGDFFGKIQQTPLSFSGGGNNLIAVWGAEHIDKLYKTSTQLLIGFDASRGIYTYDLDTYLDITTTYPLQIYAYDFEHHDAIDPFSWQYMAALGKDEKVTYQRLEVGSIHLGFPELKQNGGFRFWFGYKPFQPNYVPAVEYYISPDLNVDLEGVPIENHLNFAVCAAFFDTGASFTPATFKPGTRIRSRHRYLGYPIEKASSIFATAQPSPF